MSKPFIDLLEIEYVQCVLNAAMRELPAGMHDELAAAGIEMELDTGREDGAEGIGRFDVGRKVLLFWGPRVLAAGVGRLRGEVATVAAAAWLHIQGDPFWDRPARAKRFARDWGLMDEGD